MQTRLIVRIAMITTTYDWVVSTSFLCLASFTRLFKIFQLFRNNEDGFHGC